VPWIRAMPRSSVLPCQMRLPLQSRIETSAPATGPAVSRAVTQTSEDSRPHLKWAARFVTRAVVGTYRGAGFPRRWVPRMRLSSSTT